MADVKPKILTVLGSTDVPHTRTSILVKRERETYAEQYQKNKVEQFHEVKVEQYHEMKVEQFHEVKAEQQS